MSHLLTKTPEGNWATTIYMCPGRILYCFDVDGTAWLDPNDDGRIPNGWGSEYSVRNVQSNPEPAATVRSTKHLSPSYR
jgi:hypothetical protein